MSASRGAETVRALPGYPPAGVEPWSWRREAGWVAFLFAAALAVRLPNSGGDLWLDELATLETHVELPFGKIFTTFISANQHVLYSLLARASLVLFGETAFAIRLPAILFGALGAPLLYALARAVTTRREALASALILAFSYHHAYFSQSARGYTGYVVFSLLSTLCLVRALGSDRRADWVGFAAATVANLYMHLNGLFFLSGQVAGVLVLHGPRALRDSAGRRILTHLLIAATVAGIVAGALYAPIIASMFHFFATEDRNVGWLVSPELLRVILRDAAPGAAGLAAVAVAGAVALAGFVSLARSAPIVLLTMILPVVFGLAAVVGMGVGTYPRFFLILLPFGLLIAMRGLRLAAERAARLARLRSGAPLFAALVALAILAGAARLPRLYALPKQDYTGALAFVRSEKEEGDVVAAAYMAQLGAQYYDATVLSARTAPALAAILDEGRAVWLLGTLVEDMKVRAPELDALIASRFREVRRFPGIVGDGTIVVWRSVEPGGS